MTFYATKKVAPVANTEGHRFVMVCAASKEAADYAAEVSIKRYGFDARVLEVSAAEYAAILNGDRNGYQATSHA